MAEKFLLRRTLMGTLMWYLASPVVAIGAATIAIAAFVGVGIGIGRLMTPPTEITEVVIASPALTERPSNDKLKVVKLTCSGNPTLTISGHASGTLLLTVTGDTKAEAWTTSRLVMDIPNANGTFALSYAGDDARLEWTARGGGTCTETAKVG